MTFGAYFFQTQTKLTAVFTEKPLFGSVNKVLPLQLHYNFDAVNSGR